MFFLKASFDLHSLRASATVLKFGCSTGKHPDSKVLVFVVVVVSSVNAGHVKMRSNGK